MTPSQRRWSALVIIALVGGLVAVAQDKPRRARGAEQAGPPKARADAPRRVAKVKTEPVRSRQPSSDEVAVFQLHHAEAYPIAKVLRELFEDSIVAEVMERTNSVVVSGDKDHVIPKVQQLVAQLDAPGGSPDDLAGAKPGWPAYAGVDLKWADAEELAHRLEYLLRDFEGARFVALGHSNSIWILGAPEPVAFLEKLVRDMDSEPRSGGQHPTAGARELHFYSLEHAEAPRLADTLNRIAAMADADVHVVADAAAGVLVAHLTPAQHAEFERIVARLDVPPKRAAKAPPAPKRPARKPAPPKRGGKY